MSLLFIVFIVIGSASAGRLDIEAFGLRNVALVTIFIILLTIVSFFYARLLRLSAADSTAVQMETMVRNVNLGVLLKASMFPAVFQASTTTSSSIGDTVLFTILLYGAIQMISVSYTHLTLPTILLV